MPLSVVSGQGLLSLLRPVPVLRIDTLFCFFQVVTLREAKVLLKEDDDLIIAVYDYWLNKRLRTVSAKELFKSKKQV